MAMQATGNGFSGGFNYGFGASANTVCRGWVSKIRLHYFDHFINNFLTNRRGCSIIEIYFLHGAKIKKYYPNKMIKDKFNGIKNLFLLKINSPE